MNLIHKLTFTFFLFLVTANVYAGAVSPNYDASLDSDQDYLMDSEETILGTDPNNPDTDGDGITDFDEVNCTGTDPLLMATLSSNLNDCEAFTNFGEYAIVSSSIFTSCDMRLKEELFLIGEEIRDVCPRSGSSGIDSDSDLILDDDEVNAFSPTNPNSVDSDGDGINDFFETFCVIKDPTQADTDGDGSSDCEELRDNFYYIVFSTEECRAFQSSASNYEETIQQTGFYAPCDDPNETNFTSQDSDEDDSSENNINESSNLDSASVSCSLNSSKPSNSNSITLIILSGVFALLFVLVRRSVKSY